MRRILTGMVVGALAITAINKNKSSHRFKKGKRAVMKKVEDMFNM